MEVRADGVAVITISNPPVNALSLDGTAPSIHPSIHPLFSHSSCSSSSLFDNFCVGWRTAIQLRWPIFSKSRPAMHFAGAGSCVAAPALNLLFLFLS
jgi:hypothetical protein